MFKLSSPKQNKMLIGKQDGEPLEENVDQSSLYKSKFGGFFK